MRLPFAVTAASVLLVPYAAVGQDLWGSHALDGLYSGFSAGLLLLTDNDGSINGVDVTGEYNEGFVLGIQVGYKYGPIRPELEFEYGHAGFDQIEAAGLSVNVDGDFDLFRLTAGLYYDFDNITRLTPYFGGGLGGVFVNFDEATVGGVTVEGDDELYFTAHGEAGLTVGVTNSVFLVPAYRFIWLNDGEGGFEDDTAHLIKIGLRLRL